MRKYSDNAYRRGAVKKIRSDARYPGGRVPPVLRETPICWLGAFGVMELGDPVPPCDGRLVRCHLISRQTIKKAGGKVWDRRAWVWGCGGPTGLAGHHGMLDNSRTLRLPRGALPAGVEELAYELGLLYWLDREYGPKEAVA
jgi:hypothetical protein